MIHYVFSFLNINETEFFINLFNKTNYDYRDDNVYRFYYMNLINHKLETKKFSKFEFKKFRIQMVNENVQQVETFHNHANPWSFIIFLNDNFLGGEVVFENKIYKPKKGDMIYFSGEELHRVNNCVGNRYTLVGFMNNNPLRIKKNNIHLI